MTIGIDIDDTITNSSEVFIEYARLYNKENKINFEIDTTQLDQSKAFGWNKKNQIEFTNKYLPMILTNAKPPKNVVAIINKLREDGNKILFITARNDKETENVYEITENWLVSNNIQYDKLIVDSKNKEVDCSNNNVDIFIDDSIRNCENVYSALKIPVFLFNSNYNTNYYHSQIERVFNWDELYTKINDIKCGGNYD